MNKPATRQQQQTRPAAQAPQRSAEIVKHTPASQLAEVPEYLQRPSGTPLAGFEEFSQSDVKLPRLSLCQTNTPQRSNSDPHYIDGLNEGDFFNSTMGTVYGSTAKIVPLLFYKARIRFKAMDEGGGILCRSENCVTGVGDPGGACITCPCSKFGTARNGQGKGTDCLLIYNFPVLVADEDGRFPAESLSVLSLKSTGIPAAQDWLVRMRLRKTDMFAGIYSLTSKLRVDGKMKWYVPVIDNAGFIPESLKRDAEFAHQAMRELRDQGRLKVDEGAEEEETQGTDFAYGANAEK